MVKPKILTDIESAQSSINSHSTDNIKHITAAERTAWHGKAEGSHTHTIAQVSGLQADLNGKETPTGAQSKVDAHANLKTNPHAVTKAQVGLSLVDNVQQATKAEFNTHNTDSVVHITSAERNKWNAVPPAPVLTKRQVNTKLIATSNSVNIGIAGFNKATDVLLVFQNTTFLTEGEEYNINAGSTAITKVGGSWDVGTSFAFLKLSL